MGVTGIAPLVLAVGPLRNYSIFQQLSALNRTVLDSKEQLYACFLSGSCLTLTDIRLECYNGALLQWHAMTRALRRQRELNCPPKIENHVISYAGDTTV